MNEIKETEYVLLEACKKYMHVDYEDDEDIIKIMMDSVLMEMSALIPAFDKDNLTARQKLIFLISVKDLYDNRGKYGDTKELRNAVSSMLLKEIYGGG